MPSITVPLAIGAAATVGGAAITSSAANSAANKSRDAANRATDVQKQMFDQTTANNRPFVVTGTDAFDRLGQIYGLDTVDAAGNVVPGSAQPKLDPGATFYQSPDYKFQFDQGIKGVDAGSAARGMLDSGATRKAEIAYAGNLANGNFNTYASRLMALAGTGQQAAGAQTQAGQNYATTYGNTIMNAAADQGNAQMAGAGITSKLLQNFAGQVSGKNPYGSSYSPGPYKYDPQGT